MFFGSNLTEEDLIRRASSEIESGFIDIFITHLNYKFPGYEDKVEYCVRHHETPGNDIPKKVREIIMKLDEYKETRCRKCFAPLGENYYTYRGVTNEKVHVCEQCYIESIIKSALDMAIWDISGVLSNIYKRKKKNESENLSKGQ